MPGRGGKYLDDPTGDKRALLLAQLEHFVHPIFNDYTPTTDDSETDQ